MESQEPINWEAGINSVKFKAKVISLWPKNAGECNLAQFCGGAIRALYANTKQAEALYNASNVQESLFEGAENGLYTDDQGGEFDLVVYSGVAQMQISYRGWQTKAMRTGLFAYINVIPIHEKDKVIEFNIAYPPSLNIQPAMEDPGNKLAYVAYGARADGKGIYPPLMMRMQQIYDECRAHSKGWKYYEKMRAEGKSVSAPPWKTHEDAMCRKSVLIRFCKQFSALNTDPGLLKDEYREAGVESAQPKVAQEPMDKFEDGLRAVVNTQPPPAHFEEQEAKDSASKFNVVERQERTEDYKPVNAPPPSAPPAQAPQTADDKLVYNEAAAVFGEYIKMMAPPEMTPTKAKAQFRATYFPIDPKTQKPYVKLEELHREDLFQIVDALANQLEKQARAMPPLMAAWYKNHRDEIQDALDQAPEAQEETESTPF